MHLHMYVTASTGYYATLVKMLLLYLSTKPAGIKLVSKQGQRGEDADTPACITGNIQQCGEADDHSAISTCLSPHTELPKTNDNNLTIYLRIPIHCIFQRW